MNYPKNLPGDNVILHAPESSADKSFIIVIERMIQQRLLKIKTADISKSVRGLKEDVAAYEALLEVREAYISYGQKNI